MPSTLRASILLMHKELGTPAERHSGISKIQDTLALSRQQESKSAAVLTLATRRSPRKRISKAQNTELTATEMGESTCLKQKVDIQSESNKDSKRNSHIDISTKPVFGFGESTTSSGTNATEKFKRTAKECDKRKSQSEEESGHLFIVSSNKCCLEDGFGETDATDHDGKTTIEKISESQTTQPRDKTCKVTRGISHNIDSESINSCKISDKKKSRHSKLENGTQNTGDDEKLTGVDSTRKNQDANGMFAKPVGRPRLGCTWDGIHGVWAKKTEIANKPNKSLLLISIPTTDKAAKKISSKRKSTPKSHGRHSSLFKTDGRSKKVDGMHPKRSKRGIEERHSLPNPKHISTESNGRNPEKDRTLSILFPKFPPKQLKDGMFARPVGKAPNGKAWDNKNGYWFSINGLKSDASQSEKSKCKVAVEVLLKEKNAMKDVHSKPAHVTEKTETRGSSNVDEKPLRTTFVLKLDQGMSSQSTRSMSQLNGEEPTHPNPPNYMSRESLIKRYGFRAPKVEGAEESDGTYRQPRGKPRSGYIWDSVSGLWAPLSNDTIHDSGKSKKQSAHATMRRTLPIDGQIYATKELDNHDFLGSRRDSCTRNQNRDKRSHDDSSFYSARIDGSSEDRPLTVGEECNTPSSKFKARKLSTEHHSFCQKHAIDLDESREVDQTEVGPYEVTEPVHVWKSTTQMKVGGEKVTYRLPKSSPVRKGDGTFVRPRGASLKGFAWDKIGGRWMSTFHDVVGEIREEFARHRSEYNDWIYYGYDEDKCVAGAGAVEVEKVPKLCQGNVTAVSETKNCPRAKCSKKEHRYTKDGFLLPKSSPNRALDGTFARPRGPSVKGYSWDSSRGQWAPHHADLEKQPADRFEKTNSHCNIRIPECTIPKFVACGLCVGCDTKSNCGYCLHCMLRIDAPIHTSHLFTCKNRICSSPKQCSYVPEKLEGEGRNAKRQTQVLPTVKINEDNNSIHSNGMSEETESGMSGCHKISSVLDSLLDTNSFVNDDLSDLEEDMSIDLPKNPLNSAAELARQQRLGQRARLCVPKLAW